MAYSLAKYPFTVKHIPGVDNCVADWLSRMYPTQPAQCVLASTSATIFPPLHDMFHAVHSHRSLHHGSKRTYLALCQSYPGHGIPIRVIQDLVAECPICQKDRIPLRPISHPTLVDTIMHHTGIIGIDHVSVTPPDKGGYIGLLLAVEHDTKSPFAYPVRDYTAITVATTFFRHYCTFGCFTAIISDPGSALTSDVVSNLNKWLGIPHHVSLIGRHEFNRTEHVNALFVGHLRRLVHDERLAHRWASDTVLPLINHAMATMPNSELGGLSPSEVKFGTRDFKFFQLPQPLIPGVNYGDLVSQLVYNLTTVRSITAKFQQSLRESRQALTPHTQTNSYQPGDLVLFNPREHEHSFGSSKLTPKLLGPYKVLRQLKNDITGEHCIRNITHLFHSDRVTPFIGAQKAASTLGLLDRNEYIVEFIVAHTELQVILLLPNFLFTGLNFLPTKIPGNPGHHSELTLFSIFILEPIIFPISSPKHFEHKSNSLTRTTSSVSYLESMLFAQFMPQPSHASYLEFSLLYMVVV